jgi:MFS family permease
LRIALRSLKHRNFRLFYGGQAISLVGTWMQNVAQSWLVYEMTKSSFLLGLVGFTGQIPVFLLAPLGGTVADRWKRHHIIVATQSIMMVLAFILAGLTLGRVVEVWHIMMLAALLGATNAFDIPARQAFVVEMVGKAEMTNAIALNSSLFNGARIVGPAIAGVLVGVLGEGWCFFINAVSYIAVIAGLLMMHMPGRPSLPQPESAIAHIVEGFRYVARTRPIRVLLLQLGIVSLVGMPYAVLMPVFAAHILHSGALGLGTLMGATGVGALAGAFSLAMRQGVRGLGRWIAISTASFGVSLAVFALSRWFWLSALALVPVGFAFMVQMAASNTLIQSMVPDELRGRVMSVYSMMFMGMAPLGALSAGALASHLGAPVTVMLGGLVSVGSGLFFWLNLPGLRPMVRELILAQQVAGGEPSTGATGAPVR